MNNLKAQVRQHRIKHKNKAVFFITKHCTNCTKCKRVRALARPILPMILRLDYNTTISLQISKSHDFFSNY